MPLPVPNGAALSSLVMDDHLHFQQFNKTLSSSFCICFFNTLPTIEKPH
jgi:hypothetical protein